MITADKHSPDNNQNFISLFLIFLRLGCTSFGGPIAHLAYFHTEFVKKRKWYDDAAYADMVALCQFLPGPASSQVGMAIGYDQKGILGTLTAWTAFTLPSALLMLIFAYSLQSIPQETAAPIIHGLKLAACVIVAHALFTMGIKLCFDRTTTTIALLSCAIVMLLSGYIGQITAIILSACIGLSTIRTQEPQNETDHSKPPLKLSKSSWLWLVIFTSGLIILPLITSHDENETLRLFERFYRAGALVFGGGHVVLPLLEADFVQTLLLTKQEFLSGYGAAQALPGPMFALSAYIGALSHNNLLTGAFIGVIGIFLPSMLLVLSVFPVWSNLKNIPNIRPAITGINAGVVGLLLATFYNPVLTGALHTPQDFLIIMTGIALLTRWKSSAFSIVLFCVIMNTIISYLVL